MQESRSPLPYLFVLLSVIDAVLTMVGIAGGKKELNPVASQLMDQLGVLPAVLLVKVVSVAAVLAIATRVRWLLPVGCATVTAAIIWNIWTLAG